MRFTSPSASRLQAALLLIFFSSRVEYWKSHSAANRAMKQILPATLLLFLLADAAIGEPDNPKKKMMRSRLQRTGTSEFRSTGRPIGNTKQSRSPQSRGSASANRPRSTQVANRSAPGRSLRLSGSTGRVAGQAGNNSGNRLRVSGSQQNSASRTTRRTGSRLSQ